MMGARRTARSGPLRLVLPAALGLLMALGVVGLPRLPSQDALHRIWVENMHGQRSLDIIVIQLFRMTLRAGQPPAENPYVLPALSGMLRLGRAAEFEAVARQALQGRAGAVEVRALIQRMVAVHRAGRGGPTPRRAAGSAGGAR